METNNETPSKPKEETIASRSLSPEEALKVLEVLKKKVSAPAPPTRSEIITSILNDFIGYGITVLLLTMCWDYGLARVFPAVPNITVIQMAMVWYLWSGFASKLKKS